MSYTRLIFLGCIFSNCIVFCTSHEDFELIDVIVKKKEKTERCRSARMRMSHNSQIIFGDLPRKRITHMLGEFGMDVLKINYGLLSWDTLKIIIATTPFYVGARMVDEKLHNCFFDHKFKKNKNEPAQWCKEVARLSIGVPIALLGFQAVLSRDEDMQTTSQVFLTGMPFVLLAKDLIKTFDFDVCKRPFHEQFAKEQRAFGGFPSGHLAEATYMAVLYGMRYGPSLALPLGSVAVFVTCVFLSSNRHYLSQMVAGAGFGAIYALSANTLINSKLAKNQELRIGLSTNKGGGPALSLSCNF